MLHWFWRAGRDWCGSTNDRPLKPVIWPGSGDWPGSKFGHTGRGSAPAAAVPTTGEQAFTQVCSACHATGVNGAPKIGDKAAWGPRIAQGKDTLYKDAIQGKGNMPPKGGTTWPDATIKMTVDYMVSLNK